MMAVAAHQKNLCMRQAPLACTAPCIQRNGLRVCEGMRAYRQVDASSAHRKGMCAPWSTQARIPGIINASRKGRIRRQEKDAPHLERAPQIGLVNA